MNLTPIPIEFPPPRWLIHRLHVIHMQFKAGTMKGCEDVARGLEGAASQVNGVLMCQPCADVVAPTREPTCERCAGTPAPSRYSIDTGDWIYELSVCDYCSMKEL